MLHEPSQVQPHEPNVRLVGTWRVPLRTARALYRSLTGIGTIAALFGAKLSLTTSAFSQFVGPLLCGVFACIIWTPLSPNDPEKDEAIHLPDVLSHIGLALALMFGLAQFLPPWTTGAWISFGAGYLLCGALWLFDDTRKAQLRHAQRLHAPPPHDSGTATLPPAAL